MVSALYANIGLTYRRSPVVTCKSALRSKRRTQLSHLRSKIWNWEHAMNGRCILILLFIPWLLKGGQPWVKKDVSSRPAFGHALKQSSLRALGGEAERWPAAALFLDARR